MRSGPWTIAPIDPVSGSTRQSVNRSGLIGSSLRTGASAASVYKSDTSERHHTRHLREGRRNDGEDQGRQPGGRDGRRRDDAHHLAVHQGQAHPALPRHRARLLRPRHRAPRRHRRPGHHRLGQRHQEARRRREVRHDHARRGPRRGVRPEEDVEEPQRHHPQHPRRRHLPRADRHLEHPAARARLDQADRHRPSRARRPVQGHRLQGAGRRHGHDDLRARRRQRAGGDEDRRLRRRRRRGDGHVQLQRQHPRLRPRLAALRPEPQHARCT